MEEYCICGHSKLYHTGWENEPIGCAVMVVLTKNPLDDEICACVEFKLDNLRFIEDEAKRQGLV